MTLLTAMVVVHSTAVSNVKLARIGQHRTLLTLLARVASITRVSIPLRTGSTSVT